MECPLCFGQFERLEEHVASEHPETPPRKRPKPQQLAECPVCSARVEHAGLPAHVEAHFAEQEREEEEEEEQRLEEPAVPRVCSELRAALEREWPGRRVLLAREVDFFAIGAGDRGWGCGYRNLQALESALRREFPRSPLRARGNSVSHVRAAIEAAWRAGWDPKGRAHHRGSLGRRWIGTPEYAALLLSAGFRARVLEFTRAGERGRHPQLLARVRELFEAPGGCLPMILQHAGHSRTIVGVDGDALLVMDPSWSAHQLRTSLSSRRSLQRRWRMTPARLTHKQYQVVYVELAPLRAPEELQRCSKDLVGEKVT